MHSMVAHVYAQKNTDKVRRNLCTFCVMHMNVYDFIANLFPVVSVRWVKKKDVFLHSEKSENILGVKQDA